MNDYERRALHASALSLVAAALAYAASFVAEPGPDVAAVLGIGAVLLVAFRILVDPDTGASAWASPTGAAILALAAGSPQELRLGALALAGLSVLGFVLYPVTASAVQFIGEPRDFQ